MFFFALVLLTVISLSCNLPANRAAPPATEGLEGFLEQLYLTDSIASPTGNPAAPTGKATHASPVVPTAIPSPPPIDWEGSPPEGKIVYVCYLEGFDEICLMNADGSNQTRLTFDPATDFYPSLSPDGQEIVFSSRRDGRFEIYSMRIDGSQQTRLTENIGSLYAPEISPDGRQIVFTNQVGGRQALWIMEHDGGNPRELTDGPHSDGDPSWSPDGSQIALASGRAGGNQLFIVNANGSNPRQVTNLPDMGGRNDWSPDGKRLVFYAGPRSPYNRNIYLIETNGSNLQQLTAGGDNLGPCFSPDGNWIAFTSYRDGNNEIYIMHPDGTGVTRLTFTARSDWQPRWGP